LVIKTIRNNGITSSLAAQQYQTLLRAILELLKKVHNVREKMRVSEEISLFMMIGFMQYGET
jgi:hypothetical protein